MIAAIYCRLSKEDEDKHLESESIQNQKALLIQYAAEKEWDIYNIYCDEDFSGIDRERPAFCRLIRDAEKGRFDIILVKTQSRFTRDMELVERYIHGYFPAWGIRFVAVVDNVDTAVKGNKKARQINGLINEWYLEDLSENIRTVFDYKRRCGQYIGNFPLYGYQKSPADKHKLILDPEAAEVVKKIFRLYLAGSGKQRIASLLNEEGIPNPTKYKRIKGFGYVNGGETNGLGLWNRTTVGRILKEPMYTGDLVQGRRKKLSYKSHLLVTVPKEEWVIVPDTHEPIIAKAAFDTVSRILKERTKSAKTGEVHALAGKVKCMDCGSAMQKISSTYREKRREYLQCKLYAAGTNLCQSHSIRLELLEEEMRIRIQEYIERYCDLDFIEKMVSDGCGEKGEKNQIKELARLTAGMERTSKAMLDLYLDKASGLIDEKQFIELNKGCLIEKSRLEKRITALNKEVKEENDRNREGQTLQNRIKNLILLKELPRELVAAFVDTVEIGKKDPVTGRQDLTINWLI